jgi:hypothetical protein
MSTTYTGMFGADHEINRRVALRLREPVPVNFDANKLVNVLDYLRNVTGVNFYVNWPLLQVAGVEKDVPVTLQLASMPADQALRLVVHQVSAINEFDPVAFSIIDGIVHVSTKRDLMRITDTRHYYIGDLLGNAPPLSADLDSHVRSREELVEEICTLIQDTVGCPEEWAALGGDVSTIRELNGSLIVKTSSDNHRAIISLLANHRINHAEQVAFESQITNAADPLVSDPAMDTRPSPTDVNDGDTDVIQEGLRDERQPCTWQDIMARLERLRDRGDPYTNHAALAKQLGCAQSTVQKAFVESMKLRAWMAERRKGRNTPRATGLTDVVADNTAQRVEPDPAGVVSDDEVDAVMAKLIDQAAPPRRAELHALTPTQRRELVHAYQDQQRDREPSPLDGKSLKARQRMKCVKRV